MGTQQRNKILIVWTTVAKKKDGEKIAVELIQKKLAACVNILPSVTSHYRWQGKICVEKEFILIIKTSEAIYSKLESTLLKIHPYDCPEVLAISAVKVAAQYEEWLRKSLATLS